MNEIVRIEELNVRQSFKDSLRMSYEQLLPEIKKLNLHSLWIYGSCARGEERHDSDIDLLLLIDDSLKDEYHSIRHQISMTEYDMHTAIETHLVIRPVAHLENIEADDTGFYKEICKDMKLLYKRE